MGNPKTGVKQIQSSGNELARFIPEIGQAEERKMAEIKDEGEQPNESGAALREIAHAGTAGLCASNWKATARCPRRIEAPAGFRQKPSHID